MLPVQISVLLTAKRSTFRFISVGVDSVTHQLLILHGACSTQVVLDLVDSNQSLAVNIGWESGKRHNCPSPICALIEYSVHDIRVQLIMLQ